MSTETSATALSRRRDFAPCRTRLLTVRSRIASRYQTSPERSSSHDRPRHGPLHTATVAPATPLPASNELSAFSPSWGPLRRSPCVGRCSLHAPRRCAQGARASRDAVRLTPSITVVCNAISQIVERRALRADRGPPRAGAVRRAPRADRRWTLAHRRSSSVVRPPALQPTLIDDNLASSRLLLLVLF